MHRASHGSANALGPLGSVGKQRAQCSLDLTAICDRCIGQPAEPDQHIEHIGPDLDLIAGNATITSLCCPPDALTVRFGLGLPALALALLAGVIRRSSRPNARYPVALPVSVISEVSDFSPPLFPSRARTHYLINRCF